MITIKHILGIRSSYIKLNNNITGKDLTNELKNNYIKYDPVKEFITIYNTNEIIYNNDNIISLEKLKNGLMIHIKNISDKYMNYLTVKSQYDFPYNEYTNQCTWITSQFIKNKNEIVEAIKNDDKKLLSVIYDKCLENGTNDRKKYGTKPEGENLDLLSTDYEIKKTIYGDIKSLNIFGDDLMKFVIKENLQSIDINIFFEKINQLDNDHIIAINRDGQSFAIVRVNDLYYVLDSHKRNIFKYDFDKIYDYIIEGNPSGFFYIIFLVN